MTRTPRDDKKLRRRRLPFAVIFLALFFTAAFPQPAKATIVQDLLAEANTLATSIITAAYNTFMQGIHYIMEQTGFSSIVTAQTATSMLSSYINTQGYNLNSQTQMYVPQVAAAAQYQARATLASQSTACAWQQLALLKAQMRVANNATAYPQIDSNICRGPNADCSSPIYGGERDNDHCQLFSSQTQYGSLTQDCPAAIAPSMIDADSNLEIFLATPQFVMGQPCIKPDNYDAYAPNATNCQHNTQAVRPNYDPNPSLSQLNWVAAKKVCEGLAPKKSSTASGTDRIPNTSDKVAMQADRDASTQLTNAHQACDDALWKRTACPAAGVISKAALGAPANCHDQQVAICHALKNVPNPNNSDVSGLNGAPTYPPNGTPIGLGFQGAPALANCEQNGLSEYMVEYIADHPCEDSSAIQIMTEQSGDANEVERMVRDQCTKGEERWQAIIDKERAAILAGGQVAVTLAGSGRPSDSGTPTPLGR